MLKKIAIFNHKGGVSKTTTSFHLGWAIANKGKKVILVDGDSQCNLTLFVLGYKNYEDFYEKDNKRNIKDALIPVFKSQPKLIEPVECLEVHNNNRLFLLPGHLDFSENEVQLGVSLQLSSAFGSMKNLPGAFNYLIEKTAKKYGAEYIIVDMNPSLSAINQDILLSCDYFIVPTSPDFFSVMAIKSLSRIIPAWEKWAKNARNLFADATYPFPTRTPKFIGYTVNDFNLSEGQANNSFRSIMDKISDQIVNILVPSLKQEDMVLDDDKFKETYNKMVRSSTNNNINYKDFYCLAEISNFNKLIALSNHKSIPVFELSLDTAGEGQKKTLNWFKYLYKAIADRVIGLIND